MNKLFELLPSLNDTFLIFGGDANLVVCPYLDHSHPGNLTTSLMCKTLSDFMSKYGSVDSWRFLNPQAKEYSFYSHVHKSFSTIDYFFINSRLIPKVTSVEYHPIISSDYTPLTLDMQISPKPCYFMET